MNVSGHDINQTLEYRTGTAIVRLLPTGLLLIFLGLVIFALVNLDREPLTLIGIVLCWVTGAGLIGLAFWRRSHPCKPLFALSPDGIQYRVAWVKQILIPWHEIRGVDTIDIEAGYWSLFWSSGIPTPRYNAMVVRNATVLLLSKQFYDSRIFVDSFFLRGPGWSANFIPKGFAGPDGLAARARIRRTASATRGGRGTLACVSREAGRRAGENERAGCDDAEQFQDLE